MGDPHRRQREEWHPRRGAQTPGPVQTVPGAVVLGTQWAPSPEGPAEGGLSWSHRSPGRGCRWVCPRLLPWSLWLLRGAPPSPHPGRVADAYDSSGHTFVLDTDQRASLLGVHRGPCRGRGPTGCQRRQRVPARAGGSWKSPSWGRGAGLRVSVCYSSKSYYTSGPARGVGGCGRRRARGPSPRSWVSCPRGRGAWLWPGCPLGRVLGRLSWGQAGSSRFRPLCRAKLASPWQGAGGGEGGGADGTGHIHFYRSSLLPRHPGLSPPALSPPPFKEFPAPRPRRLKNAGKRGSSWALEA